MFYQHLGKGILTIAEPSINGNEDVHSDLLPPHVTQHTENTPNRILRYTRCGKHRRRGSHVPQRLPMQPCQRSVRPHQVQPEMYLHRYTVLVFSACQHHH